MMDSRIFWMLACFHLIQCANASSWGYGEDNGPATWGKDYPLCDSGTMQSPIDLNSRQASKIEDIDAKSIDFSDNFWTTNATGELFNNGHTVEFEVDLTTNVFNFTGGPFGNETYQFLQLHFHWGSTSRNGSEHTIGGKSFPMEMHMVCINTKYINTIDGTLDGDYLVNSDGVAVLGFIFKARRGSRKKQRALKNIVDGIEMISAESRSDEYTTIPIEVNLGSFIDQAAKGGYFTYNGSFTTPGCNEVVTWVFFKKPLNVMKNQLKAYRSLENENGEQLVDNFRPVQELKERTVYKVKRGSWLSRP